MDCLNRRDAINPAKCPKRSIPVSPCTECVVPVASRTDRPYSNCDEPSTSASLTSPRCLVLSRGAAMRRRSRAGGEPIKGRRPKTPEPKRSSAPKAPAARSNSAVGRQETEVARLTRELSGERKQRTATTEILRLLSGSHGDL